MRKENSLNSLVCRLLKCECIYNHCYFQILLNKINIIGHYNKINNIYTKY